MATKITKEYITTSIKAVADGEKIVKKTMVDLSRALLEYVPETGDIASVNRLLGVLTNNNREAAVLFFSHFLPWNIDKDKKRFTDKNQHDATVKKIGQRRSSFLADTKNNFWTWAKDNVETKQRNINYENRVEKAIADALDEEKGKMNKGEVMLAVMRSGISISDIMEVIELFTSAKNETEEMPEAA